MKAPRPTNYWDYIRVEDLLSLQVGVERDESRLGNDEVTFITVHQVFELWFKLILRELRKSRDLFRTDAVAEQELSGAVRSFQRIASILRVATKHWEVVETLTTRDYLDFRDKLMGASGFQSAQFRQIEILLGLPDEERISLGLEGSYQKALEATGGGDSTALQRVHAQLGDRPTLKEAIGSWLYRTPIDGSGHDVRGADAHLEAFVESFLAAHGREVDSTARRVIDFTPSESDRAKLRDRYEGEKAGLRQFLHPSEQEGGRRLQRIRTAMLFIETYRELPLLAWPREVLNGLVEMEQLLVVFRQRHARMVERVIGRRTGTGGSSGVDYLDQTALNYRVFRDLWAVRTMQIRRVAAPELQHAAFYGFRSG